ncbi:response regulator transcription factor [Uliginosibacterium aquaticum]|uniref:Response regulator transcription factor n=1 Tax=Uliginosibacterium aquaticum TaxID=2731212 RepID=A0ABX2IKB4_9RHOO|nr:response regulator transcription factor [Uliginosibacterium aquaticum]NSL56752.1 response regulator transcription factor [Uliginosibacterium aquaticum]
MSLQNRFAGLSVVIIDDNDTTRAMLRSILRAEGIDVVGEAKDGEAGVALVRKLRPGLVCLDVMMPNISGIEVLAQIKAEMPDVRVLMVTGSTDRDTVQSAIQGGACGYLVKPFNGAKVIASIEGATGRKPRG